MSRRISPLAVGAVVAVVLRAVPLSGVPMQTRTVSNPSDRRIERLDPALDRLIAPDAQIEVLAQGYSWSEGPVWVKDGGYLLFSDVKENTVYKWKAGRRREAVPEAVRLYRHDASWRGDGLERPHARRLRSSGAVSARRPPRRAHGCAAREPAGDVHHAGRALSGQAVQQPERSRVQEQRRSLLHRSRRTAWRRGGMTRRGSCPSPASSAGIAAAR